MATSRGRLIIVTKNANNNNDNNNNMNVYTGETFSVLQALLSKRAMLEIKSTENSKKSKSINIKCKFFNFFYT